MNTLIKSQGRCEGCEGSSSNGQGGGTSSSGQGGSSSSSGQGSSSSSSGQGGSSKDQDGNNDVQGDIAVDGIGNGEEITKKDQKRSHSLKNSPDSGPRENKKSRGSIMSSLIILHNGT